MEITQKKTDKKNLVFIGTTDNEEYYLDIADRDIRGWSFMGLRPETEADLRERARETEPMDIIVISRNDFDFISRWFDYDTFADDMEDDWLDRHDSQAEREDDITGETLYLGFGSGHDIFGYFKKHEIKDYASYCAHFEEIGLDKATFDQMNTVIVKAKNSSLDMTEEEKEKEKQEFISILKK